MTLKQQFTLSCLLAAALASDSFYKGRGETTDKVYFLSYIASMNKQYGSHEEFNQRLGTWTANHQKVQQMNKSHSKVTFKDNFTSDWEDDEYQQMLGLSTNNALGLNMASLTDEDEDAEERRRLQDDYSINWFELGKVHPVKNQGSCGSCWSFTATLAQESMEALTNGGEVVRLSEQEGVDCADGAYGCDGGWMHHYWQMSKERGSTAEANYPYVGVTTQECDEEKADGLQSKAKEWGRITTTIADAFEQLQSGPLTIAVGAGNDCWRFYESGVLSSDDDCPTALDHAVVIVGLEGGQVTTSEPVKSCKWVSWWEYYYQICTNEDETLEYSDSSMTGRKNQCCKTVDAQIASGEHWRVQNSWGTDWGDNGFINLAVEGGVGVSGMNQYIQWVTVE